MEQQQDFLGNLSQSGLLSQEQLAEISVRPCGDVDSLCSFLVSQGWLTSFQAQRVRSGKIKELVLDQYHVLAELGEGGYGCVYKARHNLMGRVVAIKVIRPELVEEPRARAWFRREVLATTQLNHPNIVMAYDADEVNGTLFFAMEYVDGPNLECLVREQGPVPIHLAAEMMQQAARALDYAHQKGMVHRDVKPANLLIPRTAMTNDIPAVGSAPVLVKMVDFGLARMHSTQSANTLVLQNEKNFVGTPAYVSPEQTRNVHEVDIRSDLYSLGCTFYFALTGRPPFRAATVMGTIVQHLEKEAEPIEQIRPEVPPALGSIIRRLMAKKPERRFQTPAELLSELSFFFGSDRGAPTPSARLRLPDAAVIANYGRSAANRVRQEAQNDNFEEANEFAQTRVLPARIPSPITQKTVDERVQVAPDGDRNRSSAELPRPSVAIADNVLDAASAAAAPICDLAAAPGLASPAADPAPDSDREAIPLDATLVACWHEWSQLLECMLDARAPGLAEADYSNLQRELLDACRSHAARAGGSQRALFLKMADTVEPWLSLQILATTDKDTLASLRGRCRQIDADLGVPGDRPWPWAVVLVGVLVVAGLVWLLASAGELGRAGSASFDTVLTLFAKNPIPSLVIAVPLVIYAAIFVLKRLLRA